MDKTNKKTLEEIIRVDHAGERGAIKIYEGQLLALKTIKKDDNLKDQIEKMKEQERLAKQEEYKTDELNSFEKRKNKKMQSIITDSTITLISDGAPSVIGKTHPNFYKIKKALLAQDFDSVSDLLDVTGGYKEFSNGLIAVDGDNRLLWRMNPRRLDVEAWRDSLLAVTGELDRTLGGPPIDNIAAARRRTLYAKVSRNGDQFASDVFLRLFDFPIMRATVAQRPTSIVPQQLLCGVLLDQQ